MKILIAGGTGMLGSDCVEVLSQDHDVKAPDKNELDIVSWDGVIENLQNYTPDVIINCAGFTDVDASGTEDFAVRKMNIEGPRNLAQCSARFECKIIHISSDYIFDGQKPIPQPYFEDDTANPLSAYGKSKMESEIAIRDNSPNYIIIRTGWLYGVNGKNFVKSILNKAVRNRKKTIQVVKDQFGSPTWTYCLALQIRELIHVDARGTYHATALDYCSRYECAKYILDKLRINTKIEPIHFRELAGSAIRPANCILENRRLNVQGVSVMKNWKEDLESFLDKCGDDLIKEAKSQKY